MRLTDRQRVYRTTAMIAISTWKTTCLEQQVPPRDFQRCWVSQLDCDAPLWAVPQRDAYARLAS